MNVDVCLPHNRPWTRDPTATQVCRALLTQQNQWVYFCACFLLVPICTCSDKRNMKSKRTSVNLIKHASSSVSNKNSRVASLHEANCSTVERNTARRKSWKLNGEELRCITTIPIWSHQTPAAQPLGNFCAKKSGPPPGFSHARTLANEATKHL
jgi:hypothetical protein